MVVAVAAGHALRCWGVIRGCRGRCRAQRRAAAQVVVRAAGGHRGQAADRSCCLGAGVCRAVPQRRVRGVGRGSVRDARQLDGERGAAPPRDDGLPHSLSGKRPPSSGGATLGLGLADRRCRPLPSVCALGGRGERTRVLRGGSPQRGLVEDRRVAARGVPVSIDVDLGPGLDPIELRLVGRRDQASLGAAGGGDNGVGSAVAGHGERGGRAIGDAEIGPRAGERHRHRPPAGRGALAEVQITGVGRQEGEPRRPAVVGAALAQQPGGIRLEVRPGRASHHIAEHADRRSISADELDGDGRTHGATCVTSRTTWTVMVSVDWSKPSD